MDLDTIFSVLLLLLVFVYIRRVPLFYASKDIYKKGGWLQGLALLFVVTWSVSQHPVYTDATRSLREILGIIVVCFVALLLTLRLQPRWSLPVTIIIFCVFLCHAAQKRYVALADAELDEVQKDSHQSVVDRADQLQKGLMVVGGGVVLVGTFVDIQRKRLKGARLAKHFFEGADK